MTAEIPGRKTTGRKLGLAMARRDQKHKPVNLTALNALELIGNLAMDFPGLITRIRIFSERYQALGRVRSPQQLGRGELWRH